MQLAYLLKELAILGIEYTIIGENIKGVEVVGLTYSSYLARPGILFAAIKGLVVDGHDYLSYVAAAGAIALVERPRLDLLNFIQVVVQNSRQTLAILVHIFYNHPTSDMVLIGITGTNGKTTTSYLIESILKTRGNVGLVGTIEMRYATISWPAYMTTPESVDLVTFFKKICIVGVDQVVMEVSSHSLAQYRVDGCFFNIAVFTNLSRDHLDYHHDLESYFAIKRRFFDEFLPISRKVGKIPTAVICLDDPHAEELYSLCLFHKIKCVTYGLSRTAQIYLDNSQLKFRKGEYRIIWPLGAFIVRTSLVGDHNLQNFLAAVAVGLTLGFTPHQVSIALERVNNIPGRLEKIFLSKELIGPKVYIDYAHTADALVNVLDALNLFNFSRLICVLGAGGDRDLGKRFFMGQVVGRYADLVILTNDNPRTEDPLAIISMIELGIISVGLNKVMSLEGIKERTKVYIVEPDRAMSITLAVCQAHSNDLILIAGKGHEDYQIIGKSKYYFSDYKQVILALELLID